MGLCQATCLEFQAICSVVEAVPQMSCQKAKRMGYKELLYIIDVLASFFLLTYYKLMYQVLLFTGCLHLQYYIMNSTTVYIASFLRCIQHFACTPTGLLSYSEYVFPTAGWTVCLSQLLWGSSTAATEMHGLNVVGICELLGYTSF